MIKQKLKCLSCGRKAVWLYMPSESDAYCEYHVPRGCSCMMDESDPPNYLLDDQGRKLPCCEFDYDEKGFDV